MSLYLSAIEQRPHIREYDTNDYFVCECDEHLADFSRTCVCWHPVCVAQFVGVPTSRIRRRFRPLYLRLAKYSCESAPTLGQAIDKGSALHPNRNNKNNFILASKPSINK